LRPCQIKYINN